jgi:hypothetical protein
MPKPTEVPQNLDLQQLTTSLNGRIRDIAAALTNEVVSEPQTMDHDAGAKRITNLADPTQDLDAVNLRTLKKGVPPGAAAAPEPKERVVTIGLDDDSTGMNLVGKYGVLPWKLAPRLGYISAVTLPGSADSMWDVLRSTDGGITWNSIFNPTTLPTFPMSSVVHSVTFRGFRSQFQKGDLLRVDGVQSGGASGVVIEIVGE